MVLLSCIPRGRMSRFHPRTRRLRSLVSFWQRIRPLGRGLWDLWTCRVFSCEANEWASIQKLGCIFLLEHYTVDGRELFLARNGLETCFYPFWISLQGTPYKSGGTDLTWRRRRFHGVCL